MFFQSLLPLLSSGIKLSLIVEMTSDNQLSVGVLPVPTGENSAEQALAPSVFTGTAQELDTEFASAVVPAITGMTKSLTQQIEEARLVAQAAAKEASEKAKEAAAKSKTVAAYKKPSAPTKTVKTDEPKAAQAAQTDGSTAEAADTKPTETDHGFTMGLPFDL